MMDPYQIIMVPDPEDAEVYIYDTGTKEKMEESFRHLVTEGSENAEMFYLVRVVMSAEVVNGGDLDVVNHGEDDESST